MHPALAVPVKESGIAPGASPIIAGGPASAIGDRERLSRTIQYIFFEKTQVRVDSGAQRPFR